MQVKAPARKRSNFPSQADSDFLVAAATEDIAPPAPEQVSSEKKAHGAHQDILSAIYGNASDEQKGGSAKEAAAANLDK